MLTPAFLGASASTGAAIAAGFGLGTTPLLLVAQARFFLARAKLGFCG